MSEDGGQGQYLLHGLEGQEHDKVFWRVAEGVSQRLDRLGRLSAEAPVEVHHVQELLGVQLCCS